MGTIDLNLLSVFVAVSDTGGFSSAARRLGVPKSSVSRAVAKLESDLGVQLIHRTTRRVALSSAGETLFRRIAPLLGALRETVAALPDAGEQPSGTLKITAPIDFGVAVLAPILTRYVERHPAVQVELQLTNELVDLVAHGLDLALRISRKRLRDSSLRARSVGELRWLLVAAPQLLTGHGPPEGPEELRAYEWIRFRDETPLRLDGPAGRVEVPQNGRLLCDDLSFVRALVLAGAGIAALPSYLCDRELRAGRLVRLLPRWSLSGGTIWLLSPARRHLPRKVTAFREALLAELAPPG